MFKYCNLSKEKFLGNVVEVDAHGVLLFVSRLSSSVFVLVLNIHICIVFGSMVFKMWW